MDVAVTDQCCVCVARCKAVSSRFAACTPGYAQPSKKASRRAGTQMPMTNVAVIAICGPAPQSDLTIWQLKKKVSVKCINFLTRQNTRKHVIVTR